MEKVVTKIGDVTIERRAPSTPLPNYTPDRVSLPQNTVKSQLDDLVTPFPQPEVLKQDNPHPVQYGVNPFPLRPVTQPQMGKSYDLQSEMEQKLPVPKGISWDYKPPDDVQHRDWAQYDGRMEMRGLAQCNDQGGSQKRSEGVEGNEADVSRYGDVSMERKDARMAETDSMGRSRVDVNDVGGVNESNYDVLRRERGSDRPEFGGAFPHDPKTAHGMGYSYSNMERLTHPGMANEKGSELHPRQYLGNNYNMSTDAHGLHGKAFSSKSPIQLSSDEEKPMEEGEYDLKVMEDFEEEFDSEEYDEDDDATTVNEDFLSDGGGSSGKGELKQYPRDGSPIVLSSEDDERNEEDVVEVMDRSEFRDLTNSNAHLGDVSTENKFSEPIVVDDSFSDSSTKDNEPRKLIPKNEPDASPDPSVVGKTDPEEEGVAADEIAGMELDHSEAQKDCTDPNEEDEESDKVKMSETETEDGSVKVKEEGQSSSPEDEDEAKDKMKEEKTEPEDEESALKSSETELPASVGSADGDEKDSKPDMSDIVCDDLMELMKKGEIEGEVEDDNESEEDGEGKKGTKRKAEEGGEGKKDETKPKSKKKKSEKTEEGDGKDDDDKNIDKSKVTSANLRKNIREVMDEMKLDEATLSAQRQEAERLKRLQDQQKIIRELQKQIVMNRQNQKSQSRVLSLLQGNSQTSILKTSSSTTPQTTTPPAKKPNHVLVKLSNGQQTSLNNKKMIELLKNSKNKVTLSKPSIPTTLLKQGMVSPSVSIAPIAKKEPPVEDKKKKKGDVVTLSSDSEDDCIVLSEEDESEPEEDPTNSGIHTTDKYNVPDDQGRVIVNVGHPESESDIFLAPQIARIIKPHQIGGIRFLYDNVIESLERFQSSTGFGCILAHSMGLGKTLQIVSFSDIFLRYTSAKTILCIMPINTIQNWLAEFNMWLPKENNTGQDVRCREFELYIVNESLKNLNSRSKVILDWQRNGGVLLMGYELFRLLSLKKSCKSKKKKKKEMDEKEDDAKNKELIEEVYAALVRPGPDLVICDEGHRIKNSHATTSQALKQIRTKRRIVLTGYPLQNNLLEYWCMVDFVRPNYLGSKTEFSNMFERPIQNGQCIDSTPQDKRLMRYRAHVLHSLLEGFVQRRSHAVLQSTLPEKEEYVLLLRFTPFQRKLYDTFMNEVVRTVAVPNPLKAFAVCCKIWNHPDVLYNFLKKKGEEIDLDLEEALPPSLQPSNYPFGQTPPDGMNQYPQSPMVPPWPRRGPGSRGGKVRQCVGNRRPGRGRKPAATVPPNLNSMPCDKKDDPDGFPPSGYPSNYHEYQHQTSGDGMMDGDRGNRNFGARGFNQYASSDYGNHHNFTGSGYDNKNPLENLEDLSSGDFQSKRFYPQQGEGGLQTGFPGSSCMQQNSNYPQSMSQSSNSDMNAGYNGGLNRNDSRFNQSDASKPYQYNQDYNSEFYSGSNYPPPQSNAEFDQSNKANFNRGNVPAEANPYYQNSRYVDNREGNMGYNMQSTNSNMDGYQGYPKRNSEQGYQQGNMGKHYQGSGSNQGYSDSSGNPGLGYPNPMMDPQRKPPCPGGDLHNRSSYSEPPRPGESNYPRSEYQVSGSNFPNNYRDTSNYNCGQGNSERDMTPGSNYQGGNSGFGRPGYQPPQDYWHGGSNWPACGFDAKAGGGPPADGNNGFMRGVYDGGKGDGKKFAGDDAERKAATTATTPPNAPGFGVRVKSDVELEGNFGRFDDEKSDGGVKTKEEGVQSKKEEEFKVEKKEEFKSPEVTTKKEDALPYDWATDLFKNYVTGIIKNSSKMEVFLHILTESINLGDRLLVFSQSLLTLDLIEDYLHRENVPNREEPWVKNRNYFRLDGSTPGLEREKLINEFNANSNIFIFLVSTRAGSLGINLVGANRVVVFDASWNPCHDTQAVCRVYRYGQQKPCFVYRLVMDSCLEKKIYDRQINKQGMADRVVDELNPDAHLSIKEVTNLCWDDQEDTTVQDFAYLKDKYNDQIIKVLLENCSTLLSKEPFQHESLLIDRKEKKLSQAEKRLAKRSYELEKQAANQPKNIYSFFPAAGGPRNFGKPIASVRPMQSEMASRVPSIPNRSKWIPAEVWQKQGMSAQEMTLPLDVVIPTNAPDKTSIVLKAGQRVMVLKSPKGIYMQLENGKIIAIRTAFKVGQGSSGPQTTKGDEIKKATDTSTAVTSTLKNNPNLTITSKSSPKPPFIRAPLDKKPPINVVAARSKQLLGKAKPLLLNRKFQSLTPEIRQRLLAGKSNFDAHEDKLGAMTPDDDGDVILAKDSRDGSKYDGLGVTGEDSTQTEKSPEENVSSTGKGEMTSSLETLRKVTENIKDDAKPDNSENSQVQMNSLKNYRHNFSSQFKSKTQDSDDEKDVKAVTEVEGGGGGTKTVEEAPSMNGNENVQNWLMNQSYPPVDPYGNYFPSYYGYGHGPGTMMNPYEGFYPNNYLGRNPSGKPETQPDVSKTALPHANPPPSSNAPGQTPQTAAPASTTATTTTATTRASSNSVYPPYTNPYQYPYNYPSNPGFNNQTYSFPSQNQNSQTPTSGASSGNAQCYDNSMYSAFHRPDGHFQGPDNAYPSPYRPPYPNSNAPGFFPYNTPYRPYPEPNYHYGANFNPYMHPPGYGYPVQNPPTHGTNPAVFNQHATEPATNSS